MWAMFSTAPLFGGIGVSLDKKKCPPCLTLCLGFAEVACVTVYCQYHVASIVCEDGILLGGQVIKQLLSVAHGIFCGLR